jgi:hypothetical protein
MLKFNVGHIEAVSMVDAWQVGSGAEFNDAIFAHLNS